MIMDNKGPSRIGSILLEKGMITKAQLDTAIQLQIKRRSLDQDESRSSVLGEILIELGHVIVCAPDGRYAHECNRRDSLVIFIQFKLSCKSAW